MNFIRKIEISVTVAILISILFSFSSFAFISNEIRRDVLRLHILANSDSKADQDLKLKVRDALLFSGIDIFNGTIDIENAVERIKPEIPQLIKIAENVIKENGFDYDVKITIQKEFFTTRTYKNVTLPAGNYLALKVIIGKGEGHNWWCVMFPAMCVPASDSAKELENFFNNNELQLIKKNPKYDPRFKIMEIYERIVNKQK